MDNIPSVHSFHIPVMGISFTIDSPIRIAQYGITSVVSIIDDDLMERMRIFYAKKFGFPFTAISKKNINHRAERVTEYLNLLNKIVKIKFENFKKDIAESTDLLKEYLALLPSTSDLKEKILGLINADKTALKSFIDEHVPVGAIDVNIMSKIDKDNYIGHKQLAIEYNDAHASLRGFARSDLHSSLVLSAGMNPRLYTYLEQFSDFYPDENFSLKKKIILKVSDFRSALIQGSFFAKKGIWVSEYRIESGLNCGGHAFATEGLLMGPILEEFKEKRQQLIDSIHQVFLQGLASKGKALPNAPLPLDITAQGGVGTSAEHNFLLEHYQLKSVGWGSPFLLVPDATSVDSHTRSLMTNAKVSDYYLSNISPLGVPFNSIKGVSNDFWKQKRIDENRAGSSCPKRFLALDKEYEEEGLCTASKKYQDKKLAELEAQSTAISTAEYTLKKDAITAKSCLCVGLANSSYLENDLEIKGQQQGVVICPGPNLAYFDRTYSLAEMLGHIYGRMDVLKNVKRPNMFLKELELYVDFFIKEIKPLQLLDTKPALKRVKSFRDNLLKGIEYYRDLFSKEVSFALQNSTTLSELSSFESKLLMHI